jgi:hypothetical protein
MRSGARSDLGRPPHLSSRSGDIRVACLLTCAFLIIYGLTRTKVHNYADDSLSWAVMIDTGCPLVFKHHLGYFPLVKGIKLVLSLFAKVPTHSVLQCISVIAGAVGIGLFYLLLIIHGIRRSAAIAWSVLLSLTWGYWGYSVEGDVYIPAASLLIATLVALSLWFESEARKEAVYLVSMIVLFSCAVFMHQMVAFSFVGIAFVILQKRNDSLLHRLFILVIFTISSACIGLTAYYFAYEYYVKTAGSLYPKEILGTFAQYCTGYAGGKLTSIGAQGIGGLLKSVLQSVAKSFVGVGRSLVSVPPFVMHPFVYERAARAFPDKLLWDDYFVLRDYPRWFFFLCLGGLFSLVGCGALYLLKSAKHFLLSLPRVKTWLVFLMLPVIFSVFFEPESDEFWIIPLPLFAVFLATLGSDHIPAFITSRLTVIACVCLFLINGVGAVLPNMNGRNDFFWHTKDYMDNMSSLDAALTFDTFVEWNIGLMRVGSDRLLNTWFFRWDCEPIVTTQRLERRVDAIVQRGGRIWLDPRLVRPDPVSLILSAEPGFGGVQQRRTEMINYVHYTYPSKIMVPESAALGFQPMIPK